MALELGQKSISARVLLAHALAGRVLEQMTDSVEADIERAGELVDEALSTSPRDALAHFVKGQVLRVQNRFDAALLEYEAAVALDRNSVLALATFGQCKFFTGALEAVIPAQEQAIRLSPRDPRICNWFWRIAMVHLLQCRTEDAIIWLEKACRTNSRLSGPHAWLASAYALKGDTNRAAAELAAARRLSSDGRYESIARFKAAPGSGSPETHALAEETFFAGLRKAGVPEE
jgi:tetratricopeptide (TPR) repeat protein